MFQIALVALAVACLLTWRTTRAEVVDAVERSGPRWRIALLAHGAAALALVALTAIGLDHGAAQSRLGSLWFAAWSSSLTVTVALWSAAVLPLGFWRRWARRNIRVIPIALAVGIATRFALVFLLALPWRDALSSMLLSLVARALRALGFETVLDPAQSLVGTTAFSVVIADSCTGYEGIVLVTTFAALYLWADRANLRFPAAVVVLPLGIAVSYAFNVIRIVLLVLLGTWRAEDGVAGFHSVGGWFAFAAVGLGVVSASRRWFATDPTDRPGIRSTGNPASFYLLPLLVGVVTAMLTSMANRGFDSLYPLKVLSVATVLWAYRHRLGAIEWRGSSPSIAIGAATFALWVGLAPPAPDGVPQGAGPAALGPVAAGIWIVVRVVGAVVTVPLAEELAFRGYLLRKLIAADFEAVAWGRFSWVSFLGSSLAFGALHERWVAGTLAGMLFAAALYRRGRLADAIVAHATANGLLATYVITTGHWSLWN